MKKARCIFIAIITFLIGTFSFCAYPFLMPAELSQVKTVIPLFEVEKNPDLYIAHKFLMHENIIVTKNDSNGVGLNYCIQGHREKCVTLAGGDADYISCNYTERLNFVRYVESSEVAMIKEIAERNSFESKNSLQEDRKVYGAEVEIEGYVEKLNGFDNYFEINITSIKQISPIKVVSEE